MRSSSNVFSSERRKEYAAEVLGGGAYDDTNDDFWESLDLGPEQIAVYSMEMSKVSVSAVIINLYLFIVRLVCCYLSLYSCKDPSRMLPLRST